MLSGQVKIVHIFPVAIEPSLRWASFSSHSVVVSVFIHRLTQEAFYIWHFKTP